MGRQKAWRKPYRVYWHDEKLGFLVSRGFVYRAWADRFAKKVNGIVQVC